MPAHHVAGLQVLVRSVVAGITPACSTSPRGFSVEAFAAAAAGLAEAVPRRYTALVPTQLTRLVDDPAGPAALRGSTACSSAARPRRRRAGRARTRACGSLTTYGMSETAGGCVYDGMPLPVSRVHVDNDRHVVLGGDTVAHGYLGAAGPDRDAFAVDPDGVRWFRTDDLGHFDDDGLLVIDGRADDVINTGGLKIAPRRSRTRWPARPGVLDGGGRRHAPTRSGARPSAPPWCSAPGRAAHDAARCGRPCAACSRPALPRRLVVVAAIPQRGPGKPDRREIRRRRRRRDVR